MPAFAPLLNPLLGEGTGVPVSLELESPAPVDAADPLLELAGVPKPKVVGVARAVGKTMKFGLLAPFPAVVFGLRSKLQLETPAHTSCTSCEPLYGVTLWTASVF